MEKKGYRYLVMSVVFFLMSFVLYRANVSANATFDDLSKSEIVNEMGAGWNLGNQLEGSKGTMQGETLWGNPVITENGLKKVKNAGFRTVRIPVSWLYKIGPAPSYTIDAAWLNRVQEVVDYAVSNDMYVLLDVHNDGADSIEGSWINTNSSNQTEINNKLAKVWQQIAERFKNYDEHLIFEGMNEIGAESGGSESDIRRAISYINAYNQTFVDSVRKTGGNNAKRWLMVPNWCTNIEYTVGDFGFKMPTDSYLSSSIPSGEKRIMLSVHYYSPWEFAGVEDGTNPTWGDAEKDSIRWANESYMQGQLESLYNAFYQKGYPIVIGEYGSVDKSALDSRNTNSRAYYARCVCEFSKQYHCVPVYWDNGSNDAFGMALFDRHKSYSVTQPLIISAIMYYYGSPSGATVSLDKSSLAMELGDSPLMLSATVSTSKNTEWIEYKSSNENVAVVNRYGEVSTTGIGTAVITASVNGKSAKCKVNVTAPSVTRAKIYMQNSSNWLTTESDSFVSIGKNGTYTISINGSKSEMSNITQLYIQDIGSHLGLSGTSKLVSGNIKINSVKFNNSACQLSKTSYQVSADGSIYIGFINTWGDSYINGIQHEGSSDGYKFTNGSYLDGTNSIEIQFTVSNGVFGAVSSGSNETIFDGTTDSYATSDASWLLNAEDNAVVTISYHTSNSSEAGWGVLGWGAVVDGEWVNGPVYNADATNPTKTTIATTSVQALKSALNIKSSSSVSYLALSPYNSGVIEKIEISSN